MLVGEVSAGCFLGFQGGSPCNPSHVVLDRRQREVLCFRRRRRRLRLPDSSFTPRLLTPKGPPRPPGPRTPQNQPHQHMEAYQLRACLLAPLPPYHTNTNTNTNTNRYTFTHTTQTSITINIV